MASKFELKQEYKNLVLQGKKAEANKILKLVQNFSNSSKEVSNIVVNTKKVKSTKKKK